MNRLAEAWALSDAAELVEDRAVATARSMARVLVWGGLSLALGLGVLPWQQNAPAKGSVLAMSPLSRPQVVEAPVEGRVVRWAVAEGSIVQAQQELLEINDLDPELVGRLKGELKALEARAAALSARASGLVQRAQALSGGRDAAVRSAGARAQAAQQRLLQARQALRAAEAAARVAALQLKRQQAMEAQGLAATRALELAFADEAKASTELARAQAAVASAQADVAAAEADRSRAALDGQASIEDAQAGASSAQADLASVQAEIARTRVRLSRQGAQVLRAPVAGMVTRVQGGRGGELVRPGDVLMSLVPHTKDRVVELYVNGLDAPLIQVGQTVRVQLEGWPAVALPGWPVAMVGTFAGRVAVVENAVAEDGRLRILVKPDGEDPWPGPEMLRQGLQARGWVLLGIVPIAYELWRLANGFPPQLPEAEDKAKLDPALKRWAK